MRLNRGGGVIARGGVVAWRGVAIIITGSRSELVCPHSRGRDQNCIVSTTGMNNNNIGI